MRTLALSLIFLALINQGHAAGDRAMCQMRGRCDAGSLLRVIPDGAAGFLTCLGECKRHERCQWFTVKVRYRYWKRLGSRESCP